MGIRLLSVTERLSALKDGLIDFFVNFQVIFGVEVFFFFLLIFFVSKVLRDNDATKLMLLYWVLILVGGALNIFAQELVDKRFFLFFVILISAFMLILFNVELKKSLWDVHTVKESLTEKLTGSSAEIRSQADTEKCITNVIKALQNMSKNNIGALVVLSKGSLPKQVLQSGVAIDAEISTQLIEGVFFPKAPLHDGAMVIHGHKIQAAGCFLPLTQKTSYPKEYGTRHRAAIGITEVANVISLVVSEETGIISIVKQGNVTRYADYDMLTDALKEYYWQEMPLTDKKRGGGLR
ncbi:MAG: DNA integrity scanning protein DisA nucleotide-binding domain protein [Clostridia bacterium]|nr:DNA integrity scanning protein DisA nucleotide-binding domain protein [Clostridia bacterium]